MCYPVTHVDLSKKRDVTGPTRFVLVKEDEYKKMRTGLYGKVRRRGYSFIRVHREDRSLLFPRVSMVEMDLEFGRLQPLF